MDDIPKSEIGVFKTLQITVAKCLRERYPGHGYPNAPKLPDGLRLEIHPNVYYAILRDPDTARWKRTEGKELREAFGVPVKVSQDMPRDFWRLVIVTEEFLLGGELR